RRRAGPPDRRLGGADPDHAALRDGGAQRQEGRRVAVHRRRRGDRAARGARLMEVRSLGVIGAGQMGSGIAQVAAQAGVDVILLDANADLAARGRARIGDVLGKLVAKGKLEAAARDATMEKIRPASEYAALTGCQYIIEAAPEDEALKLKLFRTL